MYHIIMDEKVSLAIDILKVRRKNARMFLMLKLLSRNGHTFSIEGFDKINYHGHQTLLAVCANTDVT